jgi:hypothetical protein
MLRWQCSGSASKQNRHTRRPERTSCASWLHLVPGTSGVSRCFEVDRRQHVVATGAGGDAALRGVRSKVERGRWFRSTHVPIVGGTPDLPNLSPANGNNAWACPRCTGAGASRSSAANNAAQLRRGSTPQTAVAARLGPARRESFTRATTIPRPVRAPQAGDGPCAKVRAGRTGAQPHLRPRRRRHTGTHLPRSEQRVHAG